MIIVSADLSNSQHVQRVLARLGPYADKVLKDSYGRAADGIRTDATKLIVKESGLKRPFVFQSFTIIKSSTHARVFVKGRPTPLYLYGANPKGVMSGVTKGGVSVKVEREKQKFKHAFIAQFKSGHIGMFQRQRGVKTSTGKEVIKEMFGLSVPQFAGRPQIQEPVVEKSNERFMKRFEQQSNRYLRKLGLI